MKGIYKMLFISGHVPTWKNRHEINPAVKHYLQDHWIAEYKAAWSRDKETKERIAPFVRMATTPICKRKNKKTGKLENRNRLEPFPFDEIKKMIADKPFPIIIGFHFVRQTKGRSDFANIIQFVDLLIAGGVIPDDDMEHFLPAPLAINGKYVSYDKEKPGVWIEIL